MYSQKGKKIEEDGNENEHHPLMINCNRRIVTVKKEKICESRWKRDLEKSVFFYLPRIFCFLYLTPVARVGAGSISVFYYFIPHNAILSFQSRHFYHEKSVSQSSIMNLVNELERWNEITYKYLYVLVCAFPVVR